MKAIKILLVSLFALIPFHSASAAEPKTIDNYYPVDEGYDTHWAFDYMEDLIDADIIEGTMDSYNNMYVYPENNITRAEFVKLVVAALGLKSNGAGKTFSDVKPGAWYYDYVQIASSLDIINGKSATKFAPNDKITREEMTKVIVLAFKDTISFPTTTTKNFTDVATDRWSAEFIKKAAAVEIVNGYEKNNFKPTSNAKRAEAMKMIQVALQKEQSNVASDEEILAFLKNFIDQENAFAEAGDIEGLIGLYEENSTGYFKAEGNEYIEYGDILGEDITFEVNDDNQALEVLAKSNRFATVGITGITVTVSFGDLTRTLDVDGEYKLKKDAAGNWKIYSYYTY